MPLIDNYLLDNYLIDGLGNSLRFATGSLSVGATLMDFENVNGGYVTAAPFMVAIDFAADLIIIRPSSDSLNYRITIVNTKNPKYIDGYTAFDFGSTSMRLDRSRSFINSTGFRLPVSANQSYIWEAYKTQN